MSSKPLNYTTKIDVGQTVGECLHLLGSHGASGVGLAYEAGQPVGLNFVLVTPAGERPFALPVPHAGVLKQLAEAFPSGPRGGRGAEVSSAQAARVAWRTIKDWLEAQLALVDANLATLDQVMLPYMRSDDGRSLYEVVVGQQLALES